MIVPRHIRERSSGPPSTSSRPPVPVTKRTAPTPTSSSPQRPSAPSRDKHTTNTKRFKFSNDLLGKQVASTCELFVRATDWEEFVRQVRGQSHINSKVQELDHPAAGLLYHYHKQGVPVVTTDPPWNRAKLVAKMERGSHKSTLEYVDFVRDEMADFAIKGFWTVLPFDLVKDLPNLRLSPLGCVPQRDRRPRLIVDLSFHDVNQSTLKMAPPEAMQFGRTLKRLLYKIRHSNPKYGPVYLAKIDISDGFYRVFLKSRMAPKLAVVLPQAPGEPVLVAIPLSLPMGWVESPPAFCAVTETAADLANRRMHQQYSPPHRLDLDADTPPEADDGPKYDDDQHLVPPLPEPSATTRQPLPDPLNYIDVYVDDFTCLCQGNRRRRTVVRRILLHVIDEILSPLDPARAHIHKEASSVKKLRKGDAYWATRKIFLGWLIDTLRQTIELPAHRYERLKEIFDSLRHKKRTSIKVWQQVLGELRSMALAIPGGRGLFSTLQAGLTYSDKFRVRINRHVRAHLTDMEHLAHSLGKRPTRLAEIVPDDPVAIGACDASGKGMGGVWFSLDLPPLLWRATFPPGPPPPLVSSDNPHGDITNSDLELVGVVGQQDVVSQHWDVQEATISLLNDNSPAVSRSNKGSITSQAAAAYLLRLSSLHQRHFRYLALFDHINGPANAMADDCSRLWHLTDSQLLSYFEQTYPQAKPWQLVHLRPEMLSALTSALRATSPDLPPVLNVPTHTTTPGRSGSISVPSTTSIPYWKRSSTRSRSSLSSPLDIATADLPKMVNPSELAQWKKPYVASARRWPAWGPVTNGLSAPM